MGFNVRRWGVFNLIGIGGFALQIGTVALLTRGLDWDSFVATAVGLEVAAVHNFIGHNRVTWRERRPRSGREWVSRYLRYQVAKTTTLAASLLMTMMMVMATRMPAEVANTMAVLFCAIPNYFLTDRLVFRGQRSAHQPLTTNH